MSRAGIIRIGDNTIAKVGQGILVERSSRIRIRGNLFDGVDDGVVIDSVSTDLQLTGNVFLGSAVVHRCAGARRGREFLGNGECGSGRPETARQDHSPALPPG